MNALFDLILSEEENEVISLEKKKKRNNLYNEYEEAVKKFLEDGAMTDKITEMETTIARYCSDCVNLLNTDELVKFLSNKLLEKFNSLEKYDQIDSIIEHMVFLGKISALYAIWIKKQEEIRKTQEYRTSIEQTYGLKELIKGMTEDNIPFEHLCETFHIEEKQLNRLLNKKVYFNIRTIGQQKFVSLSPEGRKLQNYLKLSEEKRYSQEEMENYIYINSHRLINMFRQPMDMGYLPKSVTVIPISDVRQKGLSFEFKYVYNEISSRLSSMERDFSIINKGMPSENKLIEGMENFGIEIRRKKNAEPSISKLRKFSRAFEKNNALNRI